MVSLDMAAKAIETAKATLAYVVVGPLLPRGPSGDAELVVPLMYNGYALDRMHIDPQTLTPLPKGVPPPRVTEPTDKHSVAKAAEKAVEELRVVEAAEFRCPEDAWVIPLAWRQYIVAHLKVSGDGSEIISDQPLSEEVRRHVV